MRHVITLIVALLVAALGAGASIAAPRAQQVHIAIDDSFVDEGFTQACGFEVTISVIGDLQVTLIRNKDGLVVRELDRLGGTKVVFSSDDGSFSFPTAPSQWDYGSGAMVGSPVIVTFPGLQGHAAGFIDSDAGMLRVTGTVDGFDEFGIPTVDFDGGEVLLDVGNLNTEEEVDAAVCSALSGD
jgi:hypothetical protein